jgi:hypothetical protein
VIDDNIICSFRFVEDVFLGTCGRDIECGSGRDIEISTMAALFP